MLVAAVALLVLAALAPSIHQRDSFATIDTAIKVIQSSELARTGFQSMALPYPAHDLDPTEQFLPFGAPFVFLSGGTWQSIFSSFYAVVAAPLVVHGVKWLVALAVVGAVVAATATTWLPGAHPVAGGLLLLATPVWLYGLNPTETTLALGCISAAMAVAFDARGHRHRRADASER